MFCGKNMDKIGKVTLTVALPLPSTEALTFCPPTAKATVSLPWETWTLTVSVWVKADRLGVTAMLVNWMETATGGAGGAGGEGCGSKAPSDGVAGRGRPRWSMVTPATGM